MNGNIYTSETKMFFQSQSVTFRAFSFSSEVVAHERRKVAIARGVELRLREGERHGERRRLRIDPPPPSIQRTTAGRRLSSQLNNSSIRKQTWRSILQPHTRFWCQVIRTLGKLASCTVIATNVTTILIYQRQVRNRSKPSCIAFVFDIRSGS